MSVVLEDHPHALADDRMIVKNEDLDR